ncbi:unnamed protein product [Peniophora sp. CBMAI 1063]|nr:unnamed protein product [Peniophora sp. CBMAI 1063]
MRYEGGSLRVTNHLAEYSLHRPCKPSALNQHHIDTPPARLDRPYKPDSYILDQHVSPGDLDAAVGPVLEYEAELRRPFAQDRSNRLLSDPYAALVDVFACDSAVLRTQSRPTTDDKVHIFLLKPSKRRTSRTPALATSLAEFQRNWSIFTEGTLSQLDWSNIVVAGGAVQACLAPLPEGADDSKGLRKRFDEIEAHAGSNVDLFTDWIRHR